MKWEVVMTKILRFNAAEHVIKVSDEFKAHFIVAVEQAKNCGCKPDWDSLVELNGIDRLMEMDESRSQNGLDVKLEGK